MEPPSTFSVSVLNNSSARGVSQRIREAVSVVLALHGKPAAGVCVLLTSDKQVRALNREFREIDEATDVLSFPAPSDTYSLGDIAIAVPYARRQAKKRGVRVEVELCYLAIHGVLHLLGFDDVREADHQAMIQEMAKAGRAAGLPVEEAWHSIMHEVSA